jgi:hypothetical protein
MSHYCSIRSLQHAIEGMEKIHIEKKFAFNTLYQTPSLTVFHPMLKYSNFMPIQVRILSHFQVFQLLICEVMWQWKISVVRWQVLTDFNIVLTLLWEQLDFSFFQSYLNLPTYFEEWSRKITNFNTTFRNQYLLSVYAKIFTCGRKNRD